MRGVRFIRGGMIRWKLGGWRGDIWNKSKV